MRSKASFLDPLTSKLLGHIWQRAREQEKLLTKEKFTARYAPQEAIYFAVGVLFCVGLSLLFFHSDGGTPVAWVCLFLALLLLLCILDHLTYRCHADPEGLTVVRFFLCKRRILWKEVYDVEQRTDNKPPKDLFLVLYGKVLRDKKGKPRRKRLFHCSFSLIGFVPLANMAKKYKKGKNSAVCAAFDAEKALSGKEEV